MAIVIVRTLIVYFALLLFMRLMGKRQLSELELPELAVAVLIADLGAHPLQDIGIPLLNGLLPIAVLFCCEVLLSGAAMCSPRLRSVMFGRPSFLVEKGQINQREMRRARYTPDELAEQLRGQGVTDLRQVEYAVLETDGTLNALLYPEFRAATAGDLGLKPPDGGWATIVINDGRLLSGNLRLLGRDEAWLESELAARGIASARETYLLVADANGVIYCAGKEEKR